MDTVFHLILYGAMFLVGGLFVVSGVVWFLWFAAFFFSRNDASMRNGFFNATCFFALCGLVLIFTGVVTVYVSFLVSGQPPRP